MPRFCSITPYSPIGEFSCWDTGLKNRFRATRTPRRRSTGAYPLFTVTLFRTREFFKWESYSLGPYPNTKIPRWENTALKNGKGCLKNSFGDMQVDRSSGTWRLCSDRTEKGRFALGRGTPWREACFGRRVVHKGTADETSMSSSDTDSYWIIRFALRNSICRAVGDSTVYSSYTGNGAIRALTLSMSSALYASSI